MFVENVEWRESSFSSGGDCVSFAKLHDGTIAVRNSKRPDAGTIFLMPRALAAWLAGAKSGEFDDLA